MEHQIYTLTGAADWPMLITLFGGGTTFFYVVIFFMVKGWAGKVSAAIDKLGDAALARERAEQALRTEMIQGLHKISEDFSANVQKAFDRMEEKAINLHQEHNTMRAKDMDELWGELRLQKDWTEKAIIECHNKRDSNWEKTQSLVDECRKERCPGEGRRHE